MSRVEVTLKRPLKGKQPGDTLTVSWAQAKALIAMGYIERDPSASAPAALPAPIKKPVPIKKPRKKKPAPKAE
jgi:hypothetical protein